MDVFEFAINQELDGEKYYLKQAVLNENNGLYTACMMLAEDEGNHALILNSKLSSMPYALKDSVLLNGAQSVFRNIGDAELEDKKVLSQLDFYVIAMGMEKNSIALYKQCLSNVTESADKEMFEYLIAQETLHLEFLEKLSGLLRNAEQWVESAEFGIRQEY